MTPFHIYDHICTVSVYSFINLSYSGEKRSLTDPLDDMKTYLKMKKKRTPLDLPPPPPPSVSHPSLQRDCEHIPEKSHKHKKRNKRDKKEKQKQLQELREERNRREERERAKSEALLRRHYGEEDKITSKPIEEIPGRYVILFVTAYYNIILLGNEMFI